MFEKWLTHYEKMIYHLLHHYNIRYDFDEFYQLALIRLWQIQQTYDEKKSPKRDQYVYIKLKFFVIDEIRKRMKHHSRYSPISDDLLIPLIDTKDNLYFELYLDHLDDCLSAEERQWFNYALAGYKLTEIALLMNKSPSTIKQIRKRAREKMCPNKEYSFLSYA